MSLAATSTQSISYRVMQRFKEALIKVEPPRFGVARMEDLGGTPIAVVRPVDRDQLAEVLKIARVLGCPSVPMGAATALGVGHAPRGEFLLIDLQSVRGIVEYSEEDLVVTARAGMRFADLQRFLASRGQWIPFEPPDLERATVGGAIAAAATSVLAYGWGTLRNHLLGIQVLHADGAVTKAGGKVVKNVAGYDLMKLYHGSLGTLALIEHATLRARALPEADVLWVGRMRTDPFAASAEDSGHDEDSPEEASPLELYRRLGDSSLQVAAAHVIWPAGNPSPAATSISSKTETRDAGSHGMPLLLVRVMGCKAAVDAQVARLHQALGECVGDVETHSVHTREARSRPAPLQCLDQAMSRGELCGVLQLCVHFTPGRTDALLSLLATAPFAPPQWSRAHAQVALDLMRGLLWLKLDEVHEDSCRRWVEELPRWRERLRELGALLTVQCAPAFLRDAMPFVEASPPVRKLLDRLKTALDPDSLFAPGRL